MQKYILVEWPESQHFIGMEHCYHINPMEDIDLDQAMFVPEGIYYEIEGNNWEDEISEENIKELHYENSNTRTSN